ncbi:G patch domain-containing protein 1-like [Hondaea fermentalgiana]|uniref:G patch domain-containing protein 1-like n=1 Tax=Hondaea fermentalgiana TaxID=2315210 RepID=A0A2R5H185_9STRA|nr:G patch domain-containing protein 1-like [Hondaea fermentalgiana]|eukprot:GBG34551.1 G patch domain-containing protein 1-like [Hondaea fermentalgiana]
MVVLLGTPLVSGLERQRVLSLATGETCDGAEGSGGGGGRRRPKVGEVYDAQGRRRLHGAFTGGFSAGYYNTVGSAEGWHGSSKFVSSRADKERGIAPKQRQQRPEDFMDEEDDPLLGRNVHASAVYDAGGDLVVRSSLGTNAGHENEMALDGRGEPFPLASRFVREGHSVGPREGTKEGEAGKVVSENEGIRVVRKEEVWLPTSLVAKRLGIDAARVERPGSLHSRAELHDSEPLQGPHFGPDQVRAIFDETIEHGDEDTGELDAQHMEFTTPSAQGATVRFKPRSARQGTS